MYVTYTRIYGWSDYGGESSYQPGYRLENMMWMTLLVYDYIIPGETRKYPELNGLNANEVAAVFSVYLEEDAVNGYQEFLLKLRKEHRTLQQNFTRFAMRWLRDAGKKNPKLSWIREIKIWLPCI